MAAYVALIVLAGAAAFFSIKGMVVLFAGALLAGVVMAFAMEGAKLVATGWLARRWSVTAPVWRLTLAVLVTGLDAIRRINGRDVGLSGWAADREGESTPPEVLIFVAGQLVATTHTKGERPDVTAAFHLGFGAQTNVGLSANFTCRRADQPVVVVLGKEKQYIQLQSDPCP
jgi:hypothetical protein